MNWTLGTLIFFYGVIPITVLCIIGVVFGVRYQLKSSAYNDSGGILAIFCGIILFAIVAIVPWAMYPYEAQYHSYTPVSGTVDAIASRLISDGNSSVNLIYVITFEGSPQQYKVNDTRMSLVNPGDALALQCVREWQFEGIDGWNCVYDGEEA